MHLIAAIVYVLASIQHPPPTTCAAWLADGGGQGPTLVIDGAVASRFWSCTDEPGGSIRIEGRP